MSDTEPASSGPAEEFEREPVPERALLGFKNFIGMYAGEHCAGTELMIGPLFVAAGVGAFDLIVGLLLGNLLAVLSWTFLTAPIAVRARLTLYYQLEKICGRRLVTLYNLANGERFVTYAIRAQDNTGIISVNGAAAHKANPGDRIIICSYAQLEQKEVATFKPKLVYLNESNEITRTSDQIPVQVA